MYESRRFYMQDGEPAIMEHHGNTPGDIEGTADSFERDTLVHVDVAD